MKIKVTYKIPSIEVSDIIEVGNIANGKLNKGQSKTVDSLVNSVLSPALTEKVKKGALKPQIIVKSVR